MAANERSPSFAGRMAGAALFTAANLVVAQFIVVRIASNVSEPQGPVTQDIWVPMMYLIWGQVGLIGLVFLVPSRTRALGAGIVAGTVATVALFIVFFLFVVLPEVS
jgi:hypothetical protein